MEAIKGGNFELEVSGKRCPESGRAFDGGVPMAGNGGIPFTDGVKARLGYGAVEGGEGGDGA